MKESSAIRRKSIDFAIRMVNLKHQHVKSLSVANIFFIV